MRARRLHYGSTIVRQGDLVTSITIICRGEALLKINPQKLSQQYKLDGGQRPLTVIQKRREVLKRGYVIAEEILKQKSVTVATLGVCELIGDVEFVLGRSKHHITAVANTELLVMEMELTELQKLMAKRDGGISDFLHNTVLCKLSSRADRCIKGNYAHSPKSPACPNVDKNRIEQCLLRNQAERFES
jgi:CRP-like cAMP-binding protein